MKVGGWMTKQRKKVPALRFKGFTNDWEQVEFGHKIYRRTKSEMSSNKLPGVEYEDINSGQGTLNKDITKKGIRKRGIFFQPFDVLFGKLRPYLKNWLYPNFKGVAVGDFWVLYSELLEPSFIYGMIQTQKFQNVANLSSGSKMPRSDWKLVSGTLFRFPMNENEQRKIGLLLLNLDKTITLHEEKQRQLERLKKALLQKMFADKTGYPALRFKGFTEKWEQRKLGDITRRYDNLRVPVTASKRKHGDIPYYGANGIQDFVSGYTHDGEFILVAEDGARDPKNYPVNYVNGKIWVNNHAHVLQGIQGLANNLFLLNGIKKINIVAYLVGGSRAKLNAETLMQLSIKLPSIHEQEKIGQLFQSLDKTITLHDKKIQYLKQLKRGLLQKMFV